MAARYVDLTISDVLESISNDVICIEKLLEEGRKIYMSSVEYAGVGVKYESWRGYCRSERDWILLQIGNNHSETD